MKKVIMFSATENCFKNGVISGEREYLSRVTRALSNLNIDYILTDTHGNEYKYDGNKKTGLCHRDYEIIAQMSNHFSEFPFFDTYSIMALWNPVLYLGHGEVWQTGAGYSKRNFEPYSAYDDFISPSIYQEQTFIDYIGEQTKHLNNFPLYMPSVSQSNIIEPAQKFEKIFYVGIGWESFVPGKPKRHEYELSNLSKLNLLDIYGPRDLWKKRQGNVNYLGEIAQDGTAIFEKINNSGITLALASPEHIRADIATNRVFEGIASGSIVISNIKGAVYEMFGDNLLYIDYTLPDQQRLQQIIDHYQWIQENTDAVRKMVTNAQEILREKYTLEVMFKNIMDNLPTRQYELQQQREALNHEQAIDIVYIPADNENDIKNDIQQICQQNYQNINLIAFTSQYKTLITDEFAKNKQYNHQLNIVEEFNDHREFSLYYRYLKDNSNNPYLTFFTTKTIWKHNHLSILCRTLQDNQNHKMAIAKSSLHEYGQSDIYEYNDIPFHDYKRLYELAQRRYIDLSTMIVERQYFFKTINDNSFGSLDYLSGLALLMFGAYDKQVALSQYITVSIESEKTKYYFKTLSWEQILMVKYIFPVDVNITLKRFEEEGEDSEEEANEDLARIKYMDYKKQWKNKDLLGKITSFYQLRKLRNIYKKARDK